MVKFTVITVCLNPGGKLKATLESVLGQTCTDVEIVVKDGGSSDGSVEQWQAESARLPGAERVKVYIGKDTGIYDAMNQAAAHAEGEFVLFLNCGDVLYDSGVLERTWAAVEKERAGGADCSALVLYGDTYSAKNGAVIVSPPVISGFTCYRNIPCHQSCFYSTALCRKKPYDLQYQIRADYDHFLWCFYRAGAKMVHMDFTVSSYEGGGYSESRENRQRDRQEHGQITSAYMDRGELLRYRVFMACTLAPLRSAMAESKVFSGLYHWVKERVYRRRIWFLAAVLLFCLEMGLLVWPGGWLGEERDSYLTGEGSWVLETDGENTGYCQEFVPQYSGLKSIGIVMADWKLPKTQGEPGEEGEPETEGGPVPEGQEKDGAGAARVAVTDEDGLVLFEKRYPYGQFPPDSFFDMTMHLSLRRGSHYFLSVCFEADKAGGTPSLRVCDTTYNLPENISLSQSGELEEMQLLTRYIYENAIPMGKACRASALCALTAVAVAFGLPESRRFRRWTGAALLVLGPYVLGRRLELLTLNTNFLLPSAMGWNVGLMYLLEVILLLCTQSARFSICASNLFLTVLYSANSFVYAFRGEPLRLGDLTAVGTAAKVMNRYSLRPDSHMAMAWCLAVLFLAAGIQTGRCGKHRAVRKHPAAAGIWGGGIGKHRAVSGRPGAPEAGEVQMMAGGGQPVRQVCPGMPGGEGGAAGGRKLRLAGRLGCTAAGAALALGCGWLFLGTDFFADRGFAQIHGFDQHMNYHFNGYLVASFMDIRDSRVREPEGYSLERVEALLREAADGQQENGRIAGSGQVEEARSGAVELPHIILIMNESFSDLRVLGNLQLSRENLPFFNSLEENVIRGYVNASVLGGGTANSEFEVFTGCSMGFLPAAYYAYQQCMDRPMHSLISNVEAAGYVTYSIHPELASNWNRDRVYRYLGFDHSLWLEDFQEAEVLHYGVSDLETYRKVEEVFENRRDGEKLFVFDLTVQNHGGYEKSDVERTVEALNVSSGEADVYLSLIFESDRAFEQLISYFAGQEEPVLICMYGDHQPKFAEEAFYDRIFGQTEGLEERDRRLNQYKTPFVIWANYSIPEREGMDIGMSYLGALVLETAGVPCSPYFSFLQQYREKYPAVTVNGYIDQAGVEYDWSGDGTELMEYRMLQYHYLFDRKTLEWGF